MHDIRRRHVGRQHVSTDVRRWLDLVVASAALVVFSPVLVAAMILVRLESRGPALFRQVRVGKDEKPFVLLKIRTMRVDNDDAAHRAYVVALQRGQAPTQGEIYKLQDDPRVTQVGRVLRRTSIDELPQLWNVLRGDMALVGPRPMPPHELRTMPARGHDRHRVRPGMTGLWQVSGRSRLSYDAMIDLDLVYARRPSVWRDLAILLRTPRAVLEGSA